MAARVVAQLHLHQTPQGLLNKVNVAPIAETDIVDIGANANSASGSAALANAFANQTIADRTANLNHRLAP